MKYIFLFIWAVLFFSGCSLKKVYEPKQVKGEYENIKQLQGPITDKTASLALVNKNIVITPTQTYKLHKKIKDNYRVVCVNKDYILTTNIKGDLKILDSFGKKIKKFSLQKTIATANTDGDVVAVVFASGKLALYSFTTKEPLMVIQAQTSVALDGRIVPPAFMNDLVLFLTLDGKIIIVNKTLKKKLRTIIVSSEEYFNNIIYFDMFENKLIVATATKILSFGTQQFRRDIEVRIVTHDDTYLYVATKQGDILKLDSDLNTIAKAHFSFAHFLGLIIKDNSIYALEKEGYLIKLSKDLLQYSVYEVDIDDEADVFTQDDGFVVGDTKILLDTTLLNESNISDEFILLNDTNSTK